MILNIFLASIVILLCVLLNKLTMRFGVPVLLAFIGLGLVFGTDGILKIPFDNYDIAEKVCSGALIFIMFYGGFGTNWNLAKTVAVRTALLSTAGVAMTAVLTGLFCHFVLGITLLESLLTGSVIASTDAASVFSILRSKKLGLKNHTDSMLELESGSNDPCSYMLTVILLSVMDSGITPRGVLYLICTQLVFGIAVGAAVGFGAAFFMKRFEFSTDGFDMAFITGIAFLSYSAASMAGGNGYLSVYLCGIILGNQNIPNQKALVHFFDGITGLMQMLIFFLLGLLATPSRIPAIFLPSLAIMLFLTLAARPLSVFAILVPFQCSIRQQLLVSFAGLRGAASIVFAIMATVSPSTLGNDLFHIVFCIVLLSIAVQGSLLPACARKLRMTDPNVNVLKTFSDYSEDVDLQIIQVKINRSHPWAQKQIQTIVLPPETLIIMLLRDGERIIPDGCTLLEENDTVILSAHKYSSGEIALNEQKILPGSKWIGKTIHEYSPRSGELVIMLIRDHKAILPKGNTEIKENDTLVIHSA